MSENLILRGTEDTPEINFDRNTNIFRISGRSYPENVRDFYVPVARWLEDYSNTPNSVTVFEVDLEYLNSGSVKEIFQLLYLIEDIKSEGKDAKILWKCQEGDELMRQKGIEFQKLLNVPVEIQMY